MRRGRASSGGSTATLELDHVRFAYGAEDVLHGIDLSVAPGGCIALVGISGGGKSTLAKLVARFYDPDHGAVRVDGNDLREVQLRAYRRQLGVVLQDPFLFSGTIADNIRFARPDATDERGARDRSRDRRRPRRWRGSKDGLDHLVREGGAGLSAGERQLISIARALLADPRILILDEATSNIDRPTEILIERALDRLLHGRTSLIIAHRLATVRRADEILVVEQGRIMQRGSERELLAADGPFSRLARDLQGAIGAGARAEPVEPDSGRTLGSACGLPRRPQQRARVGHASPRAGRGPSTCRTGDGRRGLRAHAREPLALRARRQGQASPRPEPGRDVRPDLGNADDVSRRPTGASRRRARRRRSTSSPALRSRS